MLEKALKGERVYSGSQFQKTPYLATGKSRRQQSETAGYILPAHKRQRGMNAMLTPGVSFHFIHPRILQREWLTHSHDG